MNCLCCGKALSEQEFNSGWHKKCALKFFGMDSVPEIDIKEEVLERIKKVSVLLLLSIQTLRKNLISGVQRE